MDEDQVKRKREEGEGALNIHQPDPPQSSTTAVEMSSTTPLQSPTSPSSGLPLVTNGSGSARGSQKVMRRNIDRVFFGAYDIKTWYYSPYPFDEEEWASMVKSGSNPHAAGGFLHQNQKRSKTQSRNFSPATSSSTRESSLSRLGGALSTSVEKAPALQALEVEEPLVSRKEAHLPPAKAMWVCDGCFKYMKTYGGYTIHKKDCKQRHPPGRKAYQRGAHIIWEVDGLREKLYAQNLSLFGKLFIDHKTIYFDVEPFTFYVLTDATSQFDHVLGFFSKEKVSYDDYNLACIITFPPFQKKGYGTLMIEFSYYLSSLTTTLGTPERPLSDLGFKGYLSYWCAVVLRTLALFFHDQKPSILSCLLPASHALVTPTRQKNAAQPREGGIALAEASQKKETLRIRKILMGLATTEASDAAKVEEALIDPSNLNLVKRAPKGWAGEVQKARSSRSLSAEQRSPQEIVPTAPLSISDAAVKDMLPDTNDIKFETTLERLSFASNLRLDDLCFALAELGLLTWAKESRSQKGQCDETNGVKTITVSREAIRSAIEYNRIKRPILDVNYILLK